MAEVKVDRVSKFGVMVDGQWINFSKAFIPIDVQKGDILDVTLDSKGKIVYANRLGGASPNIPKIASNGDSRARDILWGQCLNLSHDWMVYKTSYDLTIPEGREQWFMLALIYYKELQGRRID